MPGSDDQDLFEDAGPRSIFAATWFRVVLVLIVFAVIGAVSVPYILDYMNPPPPSPTMASRPPVPVTRPNAAAPPVPAPPPQPSVPTAMPVQPAPQTATPAQPAPPVAAPAGPAPPPATMPAQKAPAAVAATPPAAPMVAQAQPKVTPSTPASKSMVDEAKTAAKDDEKSGLKVTATKPAAAKAPVARRTGPKATAVAASGSYWVQVGAFRDEDTAKRVAAKVGGPNVVVMSSKGGEAAPAAAVAAAPAQAKEPAGGSDLYDIFVSGGAPPDIVRRLAGKGLASEPTAGGVVIRPSQPLRDAVALSKDLAVDGFKVQVRRAPGAAPRPAPSRPAAATAPAAPASASGDTLYRVRVGPYADRAAAIVALRDLDGKGYKGFIARGGQ